MGSLLLGLYDDHGELQHVGVTSSFSMATRQQLALELAPLREHAVDDHPWREWADPEGRQSHRMPGGQSRWSAGKDLSWEPLRIERVCEVKYDHMQGPRFRHAAVFLRWRPDQEAFRRAVTTSSRSRRLMSWRRFSVRAVRPADAPLVAGSSSGSSASCAGRSASGTCCRVDADAGPGGEPSSHGIDEHVGRLQMRRSLRMTLLPPFEACQRVVFLSRASDLNERMFGRSPPCPFWPERLRDPSAPSTSLRAPPSGSRGAAPSIFATAALAAARPVASYMRRPRRVASPSRS